MDVTFDPFLINKRSVRREGAKIVGEINPCLAFQKLVYFEHRWICYPMAVG